MGLNSINTNIAAYYAQYNINIASTNTASSVARLSSGNRIVKSSDDVAALSPAPSLRANVTTLRTALLNTSQGSSLLQVADGSLSQITDILQRQKAIAVQAGAGSLDSSQRSFLDLEFQNLSSEIDRIVGQTNFNGVKLLNGTLSQQSAVTGDTAQATKASASITFLDNIAVGETVKINGQTLTSIATSGTPSGLQFRVGGSIAESVENLAARLNVLAEDPSYATSLGQARYSVNSGSSTTLVITSRTGGQLSSNFVTDLSTGTASAVFESASSGAFKGSYFDVFSAGFASATSTISAVTAAASTPFQISNTIAITIGGASTTLHTVAANDSLQDIVNGINGNAPSTGVKAALVYDQSSATYNMRLFYDDSLRGAFLSLGANYLATTYGVNGVQADATSFEALGATAATRTGGFMFTNYSDVFSSDLTDANITNSNTDIVTDTGASTTASASTPFFQGDSLSVTINGDVKTLRTYAASDTLRTIVSNINSNTATTGMYALVRDTGTAWNIRLYYGVSGVNITPETGTNTHSSAAEAAAAGSANTTGATVTQFNRVGLSGGKDDGLGLSSTSATGIVGNDFVTSLAQAKAQVTVNFPDIADSALTNSSNFGTAGAVYLTVGGKVFTFTTTTSANKAPDEITIGSSLKDTLDNAVNTITSYLADGYATGEVAYQLNQINVRRDGNKLVFEGKDIKNVYASDRSTVVSATITGFTGVSASNSGSLNSASNTSTTQYGVDVTGISNKDFTGKIQGFKAAYTNSANTVDLSVKIGDHTYTAKSVNTNVSTDTSYRFLSDNGGYFDIQLQANKGQAVNSQADADAVATRVNTAFNSLTFVQKRNISSYQGVDSILTDGSVTGSLLGTSIKAQLPSFEGLKISDVNIKAPAIAGADGAITFTIGGVDYTLSNGLGGKLGANQTFKLVNESDPNYFLEFTTGDTAIDFNTAAKAITFRDALLSAFGAQEGASALSFQVGTSTSDTVSVAIDKVNTNSLFKGAHLNVLTQADAAVAAETIDGALNTITAVRAQVGALQSRFNFASANIQSSIQNQDAARGVLLDTDIAEESTAYATNQVKLQAGISVLAQANQQLQSLLKLIG